MSACAIVAPRARPPAWLLGLAGLWTVAILGAVFGLGAYKLQPGASPADSPERWPEGTVLRREPGRATVVMLAHPHCPCTRASVGELAALMSRLGPRAIAFALFVTPSEMPAGWERTDTWEAASAIPGVTVVADRDGELAERFGATTSGHTVVYAAGGRLLFRGGITPGRGHMGDSEGRSRIVALLDPRPGPGEPGAEPLAEAPTFGCALEEPSAPVQMGVTP